MIERFQLTTLRQLTPTVRLATNLAGQTFVVIERQESEAVIALFGAHLMHFSVHGQPLLWMSETSALDGSRPIRGGVPVCWPWFGPSPERVGLGKPQHGFARTQIWTLDGVSEQAEDTLVHLSLTDNDETRAPWPFAFELELDIQLGENLTMMLTTRNVGQETLVYNSALHTYFQTQSPDAVQIRGLGPIYRDKLQQGKEVTEAKFVLDKPVDRVYFQPESVVNIETGRHQLTLDNYQSDSVVVWNPWEAGAASIVDFHDAGWQDMVCVETCLTKTEGYQVAADEEHTYGFTLRATAR